MGHFEDRLRRKMQDPEFAAGYRESVMEANFIEITAESGIQIISSNMVLEQTVDIEISWAAPMPVSAPWLAVSATA